MTTTITVEAVANLVENYKGPSPGGCQCRFIKLDEQWGLKIYKDEWTRDTSHKNQSRMAEFDLAPKTGDKFDIGKNYCFVTEVAVPLKDGVGGDEYDMMTEDEKEQWSEEFDKENYSDKIRSLIRPVVLKMKEKGYNMWDDHIANFGLLRGNLVCIDFS